MPKFEFAKGWFSPSAKIMSPSFKIFAPTILSIGTLIGISVVTLNTVNDLRSENRELSEQVDNQTQIVTDIRNSTSNATGIDVTVIAETILARIDGPVLEGLFNLHASLATLDGTLPTGVDPQTFAATSAVAVANAVLEVLPSITNTEVITVEVPVIVTETEVVTIEVPLFGDLTIDELREYLQRGVRTSEELVIILKRVEATVVALAERIDQPSLLELSDAVAALSVAVADLDPEIVVQEITTITNQIIQVIEALPEDIVATICADSQTPPQGGPHAVPTPEVCDA